MINLYNYFNLDICSLLTEEYVNLQPLLLTKIFMKLEVGG
jgi:hypothetical protein